jgi:hypothetical protein
VARRRSPQCLALPDNVDTRLPAASAKCPVLPLLQAALVLLLAAAAPPLAAAKADGTMPVAFEGSALLITYYSGGSAACPSACLPAWLAHHLSTCLKPASLPACPPPLYASRATDRDAHHNHTRFTAPLCRFLCLQGWRRACWSAASSGQR